MDQFARPRKNLVIAGSRNKDSPEFQTKPAASQRAHLGRVGKPALLSKEKSETTRKPDAFSTPRSIAGTESPRTAKVLLKVNGGSRQKPSLGRTLAPNDKTALKLIFAASESRESRACDNIAQASSVSADTKACEIAVPSSLKPAETKKIEASLEAAKDTCDVAAEESLKQKEVSVKTVPKRSETETDEAVIPKSDQPKTTPQPPKNMTMAEFRTNRLLNQQRVAAFNSFGTSVADLQKSPEKMKDSPFYSPHKDGSLTANQALSRIQRAGSRRQLFGTSPNAKRKLDIAEDDLAAPDRLGFDQGPSTSTLRDEIFATPRTPVKTPRKRSPSCHLSPGKRTLVYSPLKGATHEFVKTAADVFNDNICKDVPGAKDERDVHDFKAMQGGLGKRKAVFDQQLFTKKRRQIEESLNCAQMHRNERLGQTTYEEEMRMTDQPAWKKFAHLTEVRPELPLPPPYFELEEFFDAVEMTVKLMKAQTCYFEKLQDVVQNRLKRTIKYDDLGRIKAYFPNAYVFRIEKPASHLASPGISHKSAGEEHLAIYFQDDKIEPADDPPILSSLEVTDQTRRKKKFRDLLLKDVHDHHKRFFERLNIAYPEKPVIRWHENFFKDYVFKIREPADLPKSAKSCEPVSVEAVLRKNNPSIAERVKKALEKQKKDKEAAGAAALAPVFKNKKDVDLWNFLSPELRKKAEENQAAKQARLVTRDPAVTRRLRLLELLPEMAGIIWSFFKSKDLNERAEMDILRAIRMSVKTILSEDDVKDHMVLFVELFGGEGGFLKRTIYEKTKAYFWKISGVFDIGKIKVDIETEKNRLKAL